MQNIITLRTPTPQEIAAIAECAYQYMHDLNPYDLEPDEGLRWVENLVMTVHEQPGQLPVITAYQAKSPEFHQLYRMTAEGKAEAIHQHENMRLDEDDE